jgi:hypothetical protein
MKKIHVPKKGDVVGALGHTGTFQVLSVDSRNKVVDLRSLEKRHVPAEVLEGVRWDNALVHARAEEKIFESVTTKNRSVDR